MIIQSLRDVVREHRERLAIIDGTRQITYGELLERIQAVREWLRSSLDLKPGDVVAAAFDNSWQYVACFFAVSELGCIFTPCNPQWRAAELRPLARRLGFRGAVIEPRLNPEWNRILDLIPAPGLLTVDQAPDKSGPTCDRGLAIPEGTGENAPALYVSTSGSTGVPRVVVRSHRSLIANARNVARSLDFGPGLRFLAVVPFHFFYGFCNSMLTPLLAGATVVMMPKFSPAACAELMQRERVDVLYGSPFIYGSIVDHVPDPVLLSSLRLCFSSGGRTPAGVIERWRTRFGLAIRQNYGMSEMGMIAIQRSESTPASPAGTCVGEPGSGVEVVVLGAGGRRLEAGEIGELAVRSPSLMSGYLGEPELSRSRFHDGYFRTGDLGYVDSAGFVYLTGRMGRVMNIAGVKVDPVEVERAVEMLAGVASCHVDAIPNGTGGEVIRARVLPRDGFQVTRRHVIEQCRQQLAEYKFPRVIEFLQESPISIAGKIPKNSGIDHQRPDQAVDSS